MKTVTGLLLILLGVLLSFVAGLALLVFLGDLFREWRLDRKRVPVQPRIDLPPMLPEPPRDTCPGCKNEIELEWCWCGDLVQAHNPYNSDHSPVEQGCTCHYAEAP